MRGLRKDRSGHRGFRPGVLILTLPAALVALAALTGCSGRAPGPAGGAAAAGGSALTNGAVWLQLQSGAFQPVADPGAALPVARRPWTVQSRVADMAFLEGTLYCGVNGSGLAAVGRDSSGRIAFEYHSDPLVFGHRTITTLIPRQGSLAIHLYFNALLNDARPQDLTLSGISLVSYSPRLSDYSFLIPPFQRMNPDWEAVGIATESENSFDFEWKYTDASETRFAVHPLPRGHQARGACRPGHVSRCPRRTRDRRPFRAFDPGVILRLLPGGDTGDVAGNIAAVFAAVAGEPGQAKLPFAEGK